MSTVILNFMRYTVASFYFCSIIGKTVHLEPHPSLEASVRLVRIAPFGFLFSIFCNHVPFYTARSSALLPAPNLGDQVPVFTSYSVRVALLFFQVQRSLIVALYNSHGHGRGILTRLHTATVPISALPFSVRVSQNGITDTEKDFMSLQEHQCL